VRGGAGAIALLGAALDLPFPRLACRSATSGTLSALWLGPDEWLVIAAPGDGAGILAKMTSAVAGEAASLVEISNRQIGLEVSGARAAEALNAFNPLDLAETAFPVGNCTRTIFGKAEIVLWRTGRETFRIEVWRSFAAYIRACLTEAGREYGGDVAA
jgi:sarcosine oxidase subunit gamma